MLHSNQELMNLLVFCHQKYTNSCFTTIAQQIFLTLKAYTMMLNNLFDIHSDFSGNVPYKFHIPKHPYYKDFCFPYRVDNGTIVDNDDNIALFTTELISSLKWEIME
jgi:hypothetical protein